MQNSLFFVQIVVVCIFHASVKRKVPCEQRLHFRGMSWRAKSSYFSHASYYRENVASARRVKEKRSNEADSSQG